MPSRSDRMPSPTYRERDGRSASSSASESWSASSASVTGVGSAIEPSAPSPPPDALWYAGSAPLGLVRSKTAASAEPLIRRPLIKKPSRSGGSLVALQLGGSCGGSCGALPPPFAQAMGGCGCGGCGCGGASMCAAGGSGAGGSLIALQCGHRTW
eukprot:scaffold97199_cov48-Phaeocystis_antarctica.AAC.2